MQNPTAPCAHIGVHAQSYRLTDVNRPRRLYLWSPYWIKVQLHLQNQVGDCFAYTVTDHARGL